MNYTDATFTKDEMNLLEKGPKHCIDSNKNFSKPSNNHMMCIENAILKTNVQHQNDIRTIIIDEIKTKINNNKVAHIYNQKPIHKTLNNINQKIKDNHAIITKADKGSTLVIMLEEEYNRKIEQFIENNDIHQLQVDPTLVYNKTIKQVINNCNSIMSDATKRRNKMIKPIAPNLIGLPKIHKPNIPIRPLVNFTTAPTYKIAKYIDTLLKRYIPDNNNHVVKNTQELINKIVNIHIPHNAKLVSFDITNMYTNIPTQKTIEITKDLLTDNGLNTNDTREIIEILTEITKQNYFKHNGKYFTQNQGLPMGNPISSTLAEIYLNHLENNHILHQSNPYANNIVYWYRYVDDILILFHGTNRQLTKLHEYINSIDHTIKYTIETEKDKTINFLDLTIKNDNSRHTFNIYRKTTQTDHTIHASSNHHYRHKIAAYLYLINRLNNTPLNEQNYNTELHNIIHIANANGYKTDLIETLYNDHLNKQRQQNMTTLTPITNKNENNYICIEYNKHTHRIIQKTFKKYGYNIAFRNTKKLINKLTKNTIDHSDTGVYKLTCNNCPKYYIGQTGRSFSLRFKEHITEINKNHPKSNFALHLKQSQHTYTDQSNNMTILHKLKKGPTLDRTEEYEIYKNRNDIHLLNEQINSRTHKIYEYMITNK